MGQTGFVFETALEEARVKARKARLAYGYDPDTPQPDVECDKERGLPELEDNARYDSAYGQSGGEKGEDVVQTFGPFCSEAEHQTLGKLSDNTLSRSIIDLAIKVGHFLSFSSFALARFDRYFTYFFMCRPLSWRLREC